MSGGPAATVVKTLASKQAKKDAAAQSKAKPKAS